MGKPSAPATPDPVATANAQTASNKETAIAQTGLNAINQYGPQGKVEYSQNGAWSDGTPKFTQTTTLSPQQQAIYDAMQGTQGQLANTAKTQAGRLDSLLSQPFSLSNEATEARLMELGRSRLDPALDRRREQEIARLSNMGIKGGTAYDRAMEQLNQGENDAYNQLLLSGRGQAVQEALTERNQPLNEIIGLASGTQVQMPSYGGTPQTGMAGTDVAGITQGAHNANMAAYGQQMGQWNNTMGGLFGLGANALMAFSDERLKKNARSTGLKVGGVPVKTFEWKGGGGRDIGVMAQDVERKHPEMVDKSHPSGYRRVNYGGLMRLGMGRAA
ncbi:MAG: tail fiber domain-containing protein [Devosia marina]|uniref:tail fiber domain-containing protein n=1 Tax=Devosia marina TaxID=2683198 RepID=UPI0032EF5CBA